MTRKKSKHGITWSIETVLPREAKKYLSSMLNARREIPGHTQALSRDMAAKEWHMTGIPLIFDEKGRMVDGQHRCRACVLAGVPFTTAVIRGVADDIYIDRGGINRSLSIILEMQGFTQANALAATLRRLNVYLVTGQTRGNQRMTPAEAIALAHEHTQLSGSIKAAYGQKHRLLGNTIALYAMIHYLMAMEDKNVADGFINDCRIEEPAQLGNPGLALRQALTRVHARMGRPAENRTPLIAALVTKAANAYMNGGDVKVLRYRRHGKTPEPFPVISWITPDEARERAATM